MRSKSVAALACRVWLFVIGIAATFQLIGCGGGGSASGGPPPSPDFSISVSPSLISTQAGTSSATVTVSVTGANGFSGSVSVTVTGLPAGIVCSPPCPLTINTNASAQLSFVVPANASTSNLALTVQGTSGSLSHTAPLTLDVTALTPKTITQIQVTGQPLLIFDHTKDQQQSLNIPDLQITAWKEADGTVNLLIPHYEAYRMRGPDLLHLTMDPNEIFSSTQSASQIPENLYNYHHWLAGPYSLDGKTFYSLAHSEWYACLLNANCDQAVTNNQSASLNSWTNTVNSFVSTDGGASWQMNVVNGNHEAVKMAYVWTGSPALADQVYLHALNHTGMFQPTRIIKEGSFYYAIGFYIHRDFTQINPPNNDQAPVTGYGYVLLRTSDFTNPNEWSAWTGGTNYESLSIPTIETDVLPFLPQQNGTSVNAAPPQIVFDTVAQAYILIYAPYGTTNNAVYYMTTKSLANPSWSQPTAIGGTGQLTTDPGGHVLGFIATNYPSILDNSSTGLNFEFTSGSPLLFWSTFPSQYGGNNLARDVYCVQLTTSYQ